MNEIITKEEQQLLLDWVSSNQDKFIINEAGPYRKFIKLDKLNKLEKPELISEIKNRILAQEKILLWEQDPFFGDLVTCNATGGCIHKHVDPTKPNREHLRFNLFLSKPEYGGDPVLLGKKLDFQERQYIKYHVNKHWHSSLPVEGEKPRITISYGILITTNYLKSLMGV